MQYSGWQVYIVECADRSLYTGIAIDVAARIAQHNIGAGAKYTRSRRPVTLSTASRLIIVGWRCAASMKSNNCRRLKNVV